MTRLEHVSDHLGHGSSAPGTFPAAFDRPVGHPGLSRPQGPAHGPTSPARAATSTTPAGSQATRHKYIARRPAPRLAAAGRLPILGRLWAPGAFRRVPQELPAKHQPGHYRRGEPGGQADQHPRPRAHPLTPSGTPTLAVPSTHSHDQPCRSVTAERRYGAPLRTANRMTGGNTGDGVVVGEAREDGSGATVGRPGRVMGSHRAAAACRPTPG
jgi:hypothetical protein